MLIRFRFENYKSVRDPAELSFVATPLKGVDGTTQVPGFPYGVLTTAAIYGANASGKSNVISALLFLSSAVEHSHKTWQPGGHVPIQPFLLDESKDKPSSFDVEFLVSGIRYRYGFVLTATEVVREWLHAFPSGKRQVWFTREAGANFRFGKYLAGENRAIEKLTRANSLFVSAAAQNNHEMMLPVYRFLANDIRSVMGPRGFLRGTTIMMCAEEEMRRSLSRLMSAADFGVTGIRVRDEEVPEGFKKVVDALKDMLPKEAAATLKSPETLPKVELVHTAKGGSEVALDIEAESAGTAAFFALVGPVLKTLSSGGALCVDELDASLHPLLALEVVRAFKDPGRNRQGAQLIFNTHDTNLLAGGALRRDEIWLTEKDKEGCTHLYPLSDFAPRRNENLERGYLQGRYGAIPFLVPEALAGPPGREQ
jgi:uncharacterized protein